MDAVGPLEAVWVTEVRKLDISQWCLLQITRMDFNLSASAEGPCWALQQEERGK